jgi:hypothetical protein
VGVSAYGRIGVLVRPLPEQPAESSRLVRHSRAASAPGATAHPVKTRPRHRAKRRRDGDGGRIQRDGRAGPRRNPRGSNLGSSLKTI